MNRQNFERIESSKPRRDDDAQEAYRARAGKRNKPTRFSPKRDAAERLEIAVERADKWLTV